MIDEQQMIKEFLEGRKKFNEELELNQNGKRYVRKWNYKGELYIDTEPCKPFRLNERYLSTNINDLVIIKYNEGRGCMVVDMNALMNLPKGVQNKIFSLNNLKNKEEKKNGGKRLCSFNLG